MLRSSLTSLLFFFAFLLTPLTVQASSATLFYGRGCSHCGKVLTYLDNHPELKEGIALKEIYFDHDNATLYSNALAALHVPTSDQGVPFLVISNQKYLVGDQAILTYLSNNSSPRPLLSPSPNSSPPSSVSKDPNLTLLAVSAAALVDAINPCAFAVLIILMTTVLSSGSSKRSFITGLSFASAIFLSYLAMGFGLYQALTFTSFSSSLTQFFGYLAIILGLFNLKDYFWYGKGFLMEVPVAWRPRMKRLLRSVTSPLGAFGIGFVVSLFLLPCTSGPYIVILGMLSDSATQRLASLYLIIYNLIFISPMLLISYGVSRGLDPKKLESLRANNLKLLHLVAGSILLLMGIALIRNWF